MINQILSPANHKFAGLHFCTNHTGKMAGIYSLSTSPLLNPHCQKRAKVEGSVCASCFAIRQLTRQNRYFPAALKLNSLRLSEPVEAGSLPIIPVQLFRFEAFGDLFCEEQVRTYFKLCTKNPHTAFALWTKNPQYIKKVIEAGMPKPENLRIVLSSNGLNKVRTTSFNFVDSIFTVFTKQYAAENGVKINCGGNSCITCQRCYRNSKSEYYINELLK